MELDYTEVVKKILKEIKKVVKGKDEIIEKVLTAILARGHILIEDIPGVGKTTLAMAFSKVMALEEKRMQFTPDILPSDVVGFTILNERQEFEYRPGAVLCNLFLADEINRTSSKTQSALLEVMEEGRVTVDGVTRDVPKPFIVIATQNPIGSAGTQMLPDSQLDRFMIRITIGYPNITDEIAILKGKENQKQEVLIEEIVGRDYILAMQQEVNNIFVHDRIYEYIASLVSATRSHEMIQLGVSPRGTIAITSMAKARAFVKGRDYVVPEDIQAVFLDVVGHRLILSPRARAARISMKQLVQDIMKLVSAPRIGK